MEAGSFERNASYATAVEMAERRLSHRTGQWSLG
jgi:hypothetical protein